MSSELRTGLPRRADIEWVPGENYATQLDAHYDALYVAYCELLAKQQAREDVRGEWLVELARAAGQLAGLRAEQVSGLEHLFRVVYDRGFDAGQALRADMESFDDEEELSDV